MFVISGISDPVETLVRGPGGPPRRTFTFELQFAHVVGYPFHFEHEMLIELELLIRPSGLRELCTRIRIRSWSGWSWFSGWRFLQVGTALQDGQAAHRYSGHELIRIRGRSSTGWRHVFIRILLRSSSGWGCFRLGFFFRLELFFRMKLRIRIQVGGSSAWSWPSGWPCFAGRIPISQLFRKRGSGFQLLP